MDESDAPEPNPSTRSRRLSMDWRQALEQLTQVGEEFRAMGTATVEHLSHRAGLVTREDFEVQRMLLRGALERLEALEQRIAALDPVPEDHGPA